MLLRLLLFLISVTISLQCCFANQDTAYSYFDRNRNPTQNTNAFYVSKTTKEINGWHKQVFMVSNGNLCLEGYYADEKTRVPNGMFKAMGENQKVLDSCLFINGQLKAEYRFYKSGSIKNYIIFIDSSHVSEQDGYDKDGNVINNYIVWRPAVYSENIKDWQKYLSRKLKRKLPGGYRKGMMSGEVIVQFTIDTTGNVVDADIAQKSGFIDLDQRALTVIQESPTWIPAIRDNQLVKVTKRQCITFVNNEANTAGMESFKTGFNILNAIRYFH